MGFIPLSAPTFLPRLDLDVRAGRFFLIERTQDAAGDWISSKVEIDKPKFVADIANCGIGYTAFIDRKPDTVMQHCTDGMPNRPTPEHKEGFELILKMVGGDADGQLRSFGKQGIVIVRAFNELVDMWQACPEASDPTKSPVVEVTGSAAVKTGQSSNYAPTWKIGKFVKRPTEFDAHLPMRAADMPQPDRSAYEPENDVVFT